MSKRLLVQRSYRSGFSSGLSRAGGKPRGFWLRGFRVFVSVVPFGQRRLTEHGAEQ